MKQILFVLTMLFSIAANAYEPLIREDRIWVYYWTGNGYLYYKFDGTVEINGYKYHKLNMCKDEYPHEATTTTVAYMRENESRGEVYTILMQDNLRIFGLGNAFICDLNNIEKNTEILLYEFLPNYSISMIPAMIEPNEYAIEDLDLIMSHTRRETINLNNREWKVSQYTYFDYNADPWPSVESAFELSNCSGDPYITIVQGVGNIGRGFLHLPSYRPMPTSMHGYNDSEFVRMTDLEGNVIFDASWLSKNGVEQTQAAEGMASGQAYDLSGKPTAEPAPGTVYIRNGRKEIAR